MSKKESIDEWLKASFDQFKPQAPDVWSGISSQLGQTAPAAGVGTKIAAAVKSASLTTKLLVVLSVPVIGGLGYVAFTGEKPEPTAVVQVGEVQPATGVTQEIKPEKVQEVAVKPVTKAVPSVTPKQEPETESPVNEAPVEQQPVQITPESAPVVPEQITEKPKSNPLPKPPVKLHSGTAERMNRPQKEAVGNRIPVTTESEKADVVIPNAFSPDGDGHNDRFQILIENEDKYFLRILDTEGQLVFQSESRDKQWDGLNTKTNEPCSSGVYVYFFVYEKDGKSISRQGEIHLFR